MGPSCPASPPSRRVSDNSRGPGQTRQRGEAAPELSTPASRRSRQKRSTSHQPSGPCRTAATRCPRLLKHLGQACQQGRPTTPQLRERRSSTRSIQAPELQHFSPSRSVLRTSSFCERPAAQPDGRSHAPDCRRLQPGRQCPILFPHASSPCTGRAECLAGNAGLFPVWTANPVRRSGTTR